MKAVILGDTHFGGGYSLGKRNFHNKINTRLIDFFNTFDYVVDYMVDNNVVHFILTGDIFDSRRPHAAELSIFSEKMLKLMELGIHTHIVIGNHDMTDGSTTMDVLRSLDLPKVHVYSDINSVTCVDDSNTYMNFIFFPFRTRQMIGCKTNKAAARRLFNRLQYELKGISNNSPKILVGHLMLHASVLANALVEGTAGEIVLPIDMFQGLDAVIMGHVHPHQIIKEKNPLIAYVGSMERKNFGEAADKKYFLLIESNDKDITFNFEKLPVRNIYDLSVDKSLSNDGKVITEDVINFLDEFDKENSLFGSIIRLNTIVNETGVRDLNRDKIRNHLLKNLNVHHCTSISSSVIAKRQLRKKTITERSNPIDSFKEFMTLEDDKFKDEIQSEGLSIIKEVMG